MSIYFDLVDLRLFAHIAESPSLIQGARHASLSPTAANARVKALEDQLGSRSLYRDSRSVELTPAGQHLLQHARLIIRQVECLKSESTEYGSDAAGYIHIFANTTTVTEFLPEILADFLAARPRVTIDLRERLSCDIVRGVLDGSTDLGIIAGPVAASGLQVPHFSTGRLVMTMPQGHPLTGQAKIRLRDTLQLQHIGLPGGITLHVFLYKRVEWIGERLSLRVQVSSFEAICWMVEGGAGTGAIPQSAACHHSQMMKLATIELDKPWAIRRRSLLVRDLEALSSYLRALIEELQRVGDGLQGAAHRSRSACQPTALRQAVLVRGGHRQHILTEELDSGADLCIQVLPRGVEDVDVEMEQVTAR